MAKITDGASVILNVAFWGIYYHDDLDLASASNWPKPRLLDVVADRGCAPGMERRY